MEDPNANDQEQQVIPMESFEELVDDEADNEADEEGTPHQQEEVEQVGAEAPAAPPPLPPPPPPPPMLRVARSASSTSSLAAPSSISSALDSSPWSSSSTTAPDEGLNLSANALLLQLGKLNKVTMITDIERAERLEKSSLTGELKSVLLKKQKSKRSAEQEVMSSLAERMKEGFDTLAEAKKVAMEAQKIHTLATSATSTAYADLCNCITLMEGLDSTFQNARRFLQQSEAFVAVDVAPSPSPLPLDQRGRAGSMPNLMTQSFDRSRTDLQMLATQMRNNFDVLIRAPTTLNEILAIGESVNFRINFDQLSALANELCIKIADRVYEIGLARYESIYVGKSKFDAMWRVKSAALFLQTSITMSTTLFREGRVPNQEKATKSLELLKSLQQSYSSVMEYFKPDSELASSVELKPSTQQPRAVTGLRGWFSACYHGNIELVKKYLQKILDLKDKQPEDESDDISITGNLICENIDKEDHMGDTGLSLAIRKRRDNIAKLLIDLGANTAKRDKKGDTLLHLAAASGSLECCKLLLQEASELLEATNHMQETPLFAACRNGITSEHIYIILDLLGRGASVTTKNRTGQTPLQMLAMKLQPRSSLKQSSNATSSQSLFLDFKRYCKSKELSDVTFLVEGVSFHAHKIVLCVQSEPFRVLLEKKNGFKDAGDNIEIPELKATAFSLLLDYLYTGDVVLPMGDLLLHFELLKCADMYLMSSLKERVENSLKLNISLENAFAIQIQANLFGLKALRALTTHFILDNYHELEFADADRAFLKEMLREVSLEA